MTEKPKPQSATTEHELNADSTVTKPLNSKKPPKEKRGKSPALKFSLGDLLREKGLVD